MPILRSVYSNPVEAGINAFAKVTDVLESRDNNAARRELMAQEVADRQINRERTQKQMEFETKQQAEWERAVGKQHATQEKIDMLGEYMSADLELQAATKEGRKPKLSDKQKQSVFGVLGNNELFDPDKVDEQTNGIRTVQAFMKQNAPQLMQGGKIDLDKYPDIEKAANSIFERQLARGGDKNGFTVEKDGVSKKIKSIYIDPKDQSIAFVLDVKTPVKDGQVFKSKGDQTPTYSVNPKAQGMVEQGNIDIANRPARRNADGSVSTVLSLGIKDGDKEVLIPMISPEGTMMSQEEAVKEYRKTGKHLGKFDSVEASNAYAEQLHADQEKRYGQYSAVGKTETSYDAPITASRNGGDPNDPVMKVPIALMDTYLNVHEKLGTRIQQLRAEIDPKAYVAEMEKVKRIRTENAAISKAFGKVDTTKPVDEQRKTFISEFTGLMPDASVKEITDLAKTIIPEKEMRSRTQADLDLAEAGGNAAKANEIRMKRELDLRKASHPPPQPRSLTALDLASAAEEVDADGKPTAAATKARKTLELDEGRQKRIREAGKKDAKGKELSATEKRMRYTEADKDLFGRFKSLSPNSKNIDQVLGDPDLDEDTANKIREARLKRNQLIDEGLAPLEANKKALEEAELDKREAVLKPLTKDVYDKIMAKKPKTRKDAEDLAKKLGFDPSKGYAPPKVK